MDMATKTQKNRLVIKDIRKNAHESSINQYKPNNLLKRHMQLNLLILSKQEAHTSENKVAHYMGWGLVRTKMVLGSRTRA